MAIMTIRIPDDVKEALDKVFEGEDKNAVIVRLIREAAEAKLRSAAEEEARRRRWEAVDRILELRKSLPSISNEEIRKAREEGRH